MCIIINSDNMCNNCVILWICNIYDIINNNVWILIIILIILLLLMILINNNN